MGSGQGPCVPQGHDQLLVKKEMALTTSQRTKSPADTFSWDVALTVENPKAPRILQPIQTVSRSAQSFLISAAQFLKKIWRVEV